MPLKFALLFLLGLVLETAHGCLCPPPFPGGTNSFQASYRQASTVVRALILSSTVPCKGQNCSGFGDLSSCDCQRVFPMRLLDTFKGRVPTDLFKADTVLDPVRCGINLPVGQEYMLNMDGPGRDGSYFLWLCQGHRPWDRLSEEEIAFLEMCRQKISFTPSRPPGC